jgi:hypothetical protein
MNKLLAFLALVLLPMSAMAMTAVSDQDLADVTGQSGVSINANLTMDLSITAVAWGDEDGLGEGSGTTRGSIGIKNLDLTNMTITSQAEELGAAFSPITIDVATGGDYGPDVTFVRYGLGTLKVSMPAQTVDVALGPDHGLNGDGLNQLLGQSYMNLTSIEFDPSSYVDIWAGNIVNGTGTPGVGTGVNQTMNISLKEFALDTISWGDTDGLGEGSTPGYIGLRNLVLTDPDHPITVTGTVSFNTGSKALGTGTPTVVHIEYTRSDFVINVPGPVTGEQVLSTAKELTGTEVLGDIYISSFKQTIKQGSYVDIYAH